MTTAVSLDNTPSMAHAMAPVSHWLRGASCERRAAYRAARIHNAAKASVRCVT